MSNSKGQKSPAVTAEEISMVREILARMNSQGLSSLIPSSSAMSGLMPDQPSQFRAAMTDASKRQRDEEPLMFSQDGQVISDSEFPEDADFSVVSTPAKGYQAPQLPIAPKKSAEESNIELPAGIKSVEEWGRTVCELQKVKNENKTYGEIAVDPSHRSYLQWIVQHGKGKSAKYDDFRNYLIYGQFVTVNESGLTFPGSNEVRKIRAP